MLKYFLVLFTSLLIFNVDAYAQYNNHRKKFRNIKWGSHIDSFYVKGQKKKLEKHEPKEDTPTFNYERTDHAYTIPNDDMSIGAAEFEKILYVVDNNKRLNRIVMYGKGADYYDIDFILRNKYGAAHEVQYLDTEKVKVWNVGDVDFILTNVLLDGYFEFAIIGNWKSDADHFKNISVEDF